MTRQDQMKLTRRAQRHVKRAFNLPVVLTKRRIFSKRKTAPQTAFVDPFAEQKPCWMRQ